MNGLSLLSPHYESPDRQNDLIMDIYQTTQLVEFSGTPGFVIRPQTIWADLACDYGFVGFLETFPESLKLCAKLLGWNSVPRPVWENKGKGRDDFDLLKEERQSIMQNNKEEYEWREEAKRLFSPKQK